MDNWRLIESPPADGVTNMAADVAILESVMAGAPPTLRFYSWSPYCLSLGYGQRARDVDLNRLEKYGFTLVRRPTGGRAVLHADEFTYSIALPAGHPLTSGNISESYRRISAAWLIALTSMGVQVSASPATLLSPSAAPICFEVTSDYEIACWGRKLMGSAQMRRHGALLQHGSLPRSGDTGMIAEVLAYAEEDERQVAIQSVRDHAIALDEALGGHAPVHEQIVTAVVEAVKSAFDVNLYSAQLSGEEIARSAQLHEVYAADSWTFRR